MSATHRFLAIVFMSLAATASARAAAPPRAEPSASVIKVQAVLREGKAAEAAKQSETALALYKDAEAIARREQLPNLAALAVNNQAVIYLRQDKPAEAIAALKPALESADAASKALLHYNYGRALEDKGDELAAAFSEFNAALQADAHFRPAIDGAFRIILRQDRPEEAAKLAAWLAANGEPIEAMKQVRPCLKKWPSQEIMRSLLECYIAAGYGPAEFDHSEREFIGEIRGIKGTEDIETVFFAKFAEAFTPDDAREFNRWRGEDAKLFSRFIKSVADRWIEHDKAQAAARYASAWRVDKYNSDAALYLFTTLSTTKQLDRDSRARERIVEGLVEGKMEVYNFPVRTSQDKLNLMRLHVVLADIWEREPDPRGEDWRTPRFQLSRAAALQDELVRENKLEGFKPSPQINLKLAQIYAAKSAKDEAIKQFLDAKTLAVSQKDVAQATKVTAAAHDFSAKLDIDQRKHFEEALKNAGR